MIEPVSQFEGRKREHIAFALKSENEALGFNGLDRVELIHEAIPDINFDQVDISTTLLGNAQKTPFLISSMTAGHVDSINLNVRLAKASAERGWLMGVGSQRRELFDSDAHAEWLTVRASAPKAKLLGNLGLSQLIQTQTDQIKRLVDTLEATAMIIHLNPLQECLQAEGTPNFKSGILKIAQLVKELGVPVVIKETGCGFSKETLKRLNETGVAAVDVSGFGGTHWGRIEGERHADVAGIKAQAAHTFSHWGISTFESLQNAECVKPKYEVWASGGIRSGLEAAKTLSMGASCVGFAKPILQAALVSEEELNKKLATLEFELKTAMFCTGSQRIGELKSKKVVK